MSSIPIPSNQVRTQGKIAQHEHCDDADAKRVNLVSPDGIVKVDVVTDGSGVNRLAVDTALTLTDVTVDSEIRAKSGDDIALAGHSTRFIYLDDVDFVKASLDTTSFTEIFSFVDLIKDFRFRKIKVKADTLGQFRIKVGGIIQDYFITSPLERNAIFIFDEDLDVSSTTTLKVEFRPERLRISDYNFHLRMEGYECV